MLVWARVDLNKEYVKLLKKKKKNNINDNALISTRQSLTI